MASFFLRLSLGDNEVLLNSALFFEAGSTRYWTNPGENSSYINGLLVKWQEEAMAIKVDSTTRTWRPANMHTEPGLTFQVGTKANQSINVAMGAADA